MRQATLIVRCDRLIYQQEGQEQTLVVGTPAWYGWLRTATTFVFTCDCGTFTARKERAGNKRGGWYWRAYHQQDGKLRRVYVGKSEELTLQRLNTVAATLAQRDDATRDEREPVQPIVQEQPGSTGDRGRFLQPSTGVSWNPAEPGAASESAARRSTTLPAPLMPLIGREREVAAAWTLLQRPEVRLLTLTGTGGVGKTRLALEIASALQADFPDGVCLVSLAPIHDAALVLPTMARALRLQETGTRLPPLEHLKVALRDKHLLVLLDNVEHVIAAAPLLVDLLVACSRLKLLVTSRARLNVRGERIFTVQPLALSDPKHLLDCETLSRYGAVALFLERAREVQPGFQLTRDNARLIAEICQRLDGLPLAIELAAARLKLLPLQTLLERLEHRLHLLTGGPRDLPVRQQTLRNTLQWSYDLLSDEEQRLFRGLAVFSGGCTLEAVETISRALVGETAHVLDGITSLLDKHLLYQTEQSGQEPRLEMLETIREYAQEALTASGELEAARQAHAEYYLHLAEKAKLEFRGPRQALWLERLKREYDNLRVVMHWSLEHVKDEKARQCTDDKSEMALRLGGALWDFWAVWGYPSEGYHFLVRALAESEAPTAPVRVRALIGVGALALLHGDYERAEKVSAESLALCRDLGDQPGSGYALFQQGSVALARHKYAAARSLFEESFGLLKGIGEIHDMAYLNMNLGRTAFAQGEDSRAVVLLEEGLAQFRAIGNKASVPWALLHLARVVLHQGDIARAQVLLEESLALDRKLGNKWGMAYALTLLGQIAFQRGETGTAEAFLKESLQVYRDVGDRRGVARSLLHIADLAASQESYAEAETYYKESLALAQASDQRSLIASGLEGLGLVVAVQGQSVWAAQLWGAAEFLRGATGMWLPPIERADYERTVTSIRIRLGEHAFAKAWAEGRMMTPEQVVAAQGKPLLPARTGMKSKMPKHKTAVPSYPNELTEREMEVLRQVAQGLTDAQIAQALVISPRTVNAHLRSIYSKLGLTSRHAAMHYALEHHLV